MPWSHEFYVEYAHRICIFLYIEVTAKVSRVLKINFTQRCILNDVFSVIVFYMSRLMRNLCNTDYFLNLQSE